MRPRSIRQRLKYWQIFSRWLTAAGWTKVPEQASAFLQYLEARTEESCAKSVPRQLQLGYDFFETMGRFSASLALSSDIEHVVASLEAELKRWRALLSRGTLRSSCKSKRVNYPIWSENI